MSRQEHFDLSVVMVNWNSASLTSVAIESLRERTAGLDYELILIDNGSTRDDSAALLPARFPWVMFVANPDNRGFSVANNQGMRMARGRYVLLLNSDTVQTENALEKSVRYMDEHSEVGALGILHLNRDAARSVQPSFHRFPRPWEEVRGLLGLGNAGIPGEPAAAALPGEQDVDWVCGSFLLMRRECMEQVGGLDERFFIYDEDIDWCLRARRADWKVRFWPGAAMIHVGAASLPHMRDKTFAHFRSHLTYIRKNHSLAAAACYYAAMALRLTGATARQALRCAGGRATAGDLRERVSRQLRFLLLRSSRRGC